MSFDLCLRVHSRLFVVAHYKGEIQIGSVRNLVFDLNYQRMRCLLGRNNVALEALNAGRVLRANGAIKAVVDAGLGVDRGGRNNLSEDSEHLPKSIRQQSTLQSITNQNQKRALLQKHTTFIHVTTNRPRASNLE